MTSRPAILVPLVAVGLLAAACTGGDADDATATVASTVPTSTTIASAPTITTPATSAAEVAPPSLDSRFDQIVGWLNGEPFEEALFEAAFGESFRQQLTYHELAEIGGALATSGPWSRVDEQRSDDGHGLVAHLTPADGSTDLQVTLVVGPGDEARIEVLQFAPVVEVEPAATAGEAADALVELGEVAIGAFEVVDGRCGAPVLDRGAELQAPIGSAIKLWVLAAVVDAVQQGTLSWDDEVTIDDRLDSLPSGITQDEPAGSTVSVRELAERMISISDNTATDVLVDVLGREVVEATLTTTGHAAPELDRPLLTTREFFVLKLDGELRDAYLVADEVARRELLAGAVAEADLEGLATSAAGWTGPVEVETLEWFASPADLCRVLGSLAADDEARGVLSINPGVPDERGRWTFIGYKGGSEPGVINLSWIVEDDDGTSYVVAGSVWNTETPLDETTASVRLAEVRDLIGR